VKFLPQPESQAGSFRDNRIQGSAKNVLATLGLTVGQAIGEGSKNIMEDWFSFPSNSNVMVSKGNRDDLVVGLVREIKMRAKFG